MKVSMTSSQEPYKMYVNVLDFKDKKEQKIIYNKVQELIKEYNTKRRVF